MQGKSVIKVLFTVITVTFLVQSVPAMPPVQSIMSGNSIAYNSNEDGVVTFDNSVKGLKIAADWLVRKYRNLYDARG